MIGLGILRPSGNKGQTSLQMRLKPTFSIEISIIYDAESF